MSNSLRTERCLGLLSSDYLHGSSLESFRGIKDAIRDNSKAENVC